MGSTFGSQQQTLDFNLHDSQDGFFDQQIGQFNQQRPPTGNMQNNQNKTFSNGFNQQQPGSRGGGPQNAYGNNQPASRSGTGQMSRTQGQGFYPGGGLPRNPSSMNMQGGAPGRSGSGLG